MKQKIELDIGNLPSSISDWVTWLISWLTLDVEAMELLLFDARSSILGATGNNKSGYITEQVLNDLIPGINAWIFGRPLKEIELALGGEPDSNNQTKKSCPRARELVGTVLPRALSFIMGLITRVVTEVNPYHLQENLSPDVVDSLSAAIRLGYNTHEKLNFSFSNPSILSRVGVHRTYSQESEQ